MKTTKIKIRLALCLATGIMLTIFSCKKVNETTPGPEKSGPDQTHTFTIDGNKVIIKEIGGIYYFADDITLSPQQFNLLKANNNKSLSTTERGLIINNLVKRWTNGIVYYDLSGLGADTSWTLKAMQNISRVSPVVFVQRTTQANYIKFVKGTGNSSSVGMIGGAQNLNIYNYNYPGILMHEIFHALGVNHEQCRPDRDSYAIFYPENVPDDKEYNFNKLSATSNTTVGPFDFESIMMYEPYAFSNTGLPSITKLDGSTYQSSYPTSNLTPTDIATINQMYSGFTYVGLPANTSYEIATALDNNKLLNVSGGSSSDGAQIILYTDGNSNNARWSVTQNAEGYYQLSPLNAPGKVLTVVGAATANGTKLEIRTNSNTTAQQFNIIPVAGGYYTMAPRNVPSKNVDVPGSNTANSTLLNIWSEGSGNNQKFKFNTF